MTSKFIWGDSPLVMSEIPYTTFLGQAHVMTISPGERAEWVGKIFRTLTSKICHLQLGTPFHNRPAVLELGSLEKVASRSHHLQFHHSLPAASLVPTWRDPLYVRWSRREILREHNLFLHRRNLWEFSSMWDTSSWTSAAARCQWHFWPGALTYFWSWPSLLASGRDKNRNKQTNKPIIFNNLVIVI